MLVYMIVVRDKSIALLDILNNAIYLHLVVNILLGIYHL